MAHDDIETERDTVPLPDAKLPGPEAAPASGHLIGGSELDGGAGVSRAGIGRPGADRPIASPFQIAPPAADPADPADPDDADVDSIAVTSSRTGEEPEPEDDYLDAPEDRRRPPTDPHSQTVQLSPSAASGISGRSMGLVAAAVAGVLVVGGAVAATVGGGTGKGPDKSAAPTAGLVGQQISSSGDGVYASDATSGSPWVWQTGQSTAKYPGATTGTASVPGGPKPTGTASGPGSQSSGPGMPQHSSSAPGVPSGSQPSSSAGGPGTPPSAPPPATVTLVAGRGCPGLPGGGYAAVGSGTGSGWGSNGSGGWSGDGCDASMQSMPMTGDASNGANRALWSFGSGTAGFASCTVSVYVPWDGKATDTGGTAAQYQVSEGAADTTVASFTVNQNTTHGQWVKLGTVNVGGNTVKLRLLDHGDDSAGWRYGVSAAELQCAA